MQHVYVCKLTRANTTIVNLYPELANFVPYRCRFKNDLGIEKGGNIIWRLLNTYCSLVDIWYIYGTTLFQNLWFKH